MLSSDAWTLAGLAVANAVLGLTAVGWNGVYLAEIARALSVEKVGSTTRGVLRSNARAFRRTSLCRNRTHFPAVELSGAAFRFREPSLRQFFVRGIVETQQQLLGELRTFIRWQFQSSSMQRLGIHDALLHGLLNGAPVA